MKRPMTASAGFITSVSELVRIPSVSGTDEENAIQEVLAADLASTRLTLGNTQADLDKTRDSLAREVARADEMDKSLAALQGDRATTSREASQAVTICEQGNDPICVAEAKKIR